MGNKAGQIEVPPTDEEARESVNQLFAISHELTFHEIEPILRKILVKIKNDRPYRDKNVSKPVLHIFLHPFYRDMTLKILRLLFQQLSSNLKKKSLMFVSRQTWVHCQILSQYLNIFTNERLRSMLNSLPERIRKGDILESVSLEYDGENPDIPNVFESLGIDERRQNMTILRDILHASLILKESTVGRSAGSYCLIYNLAQNLLPIFLRLLIDTDESDSETSKLYYSEQSFKKNMVTCGYLIGYSLENEESCLVDLALLFLQLLLRNKEGSPNIPSIPSHAFHSLPIMVCANIYEQIASLLLFGLTELKAIEGAENKNDKKKYGFKFKFNRIKALRLIKQIVVESKPQNKQAPYYLELLCKTVGIKKIEKFCLFNLVETYCSVTGFSTSGIEKYLAKMRGEKNKQVFSEQSSQTNIQVNYSAFEGVDPSSVDKELEGIMGDSQKQFLLMSEKMIYERFCKVVPVEDSTETFLIPLIEPFLEKIKNKGLQKYELKVQNIEGDLEQKKEKKQTKKKKEAEKMKEEQV